MCCGCTNLRFLTIGRGVKKIYKNAFNGCNNLSEVVIPETVTSIVGDGVFAKSTVICGIKGSAAEEYAENYGYTFKELSNDTYITNSTAEKINGTIVLSSRVNADISKLYLHIALYDSSNNLLDYLVVPTIKSTDNAYVVFRDIPGASYAKVFVWSAINTLSPEAKAETVQIE